MKARILIVDDVVENIDVLHGMLSREYDIIAATDGKTALELSVGENPPDIILLDIMMPEMDGYEVCRELKSNVNTEKIPVIFVTAKDDDIDEARGFELGAVDYITKPVKPVIVKARVATHLALYDQQRSLQMLVNERTSEISKTRLEIIRRLGRAAEYKDNETGMHVIRMSHYCRLIALDYGMSEEEAELILNAAPMHDVGKIGIPDSILLKPGKLTDEEWEIMKRHPFYGYRIIGEHDSVLLKLAAVVAHEHHEKWNGMGYPRGLKGEEINVNARIVAIADVFDALTSDRPYKEAWPIEKAVDLIKEEKGKHFDAELAQSFLNVLPEVKKIMTEFSDEKEDR